MASVSRCDVCNEIMEHNDGHFVKIYTEKETGNQGVMMVNIEVCPHCFDKVQRVLDIRE